MFTRDLILQKFNWSLLYGLQHQTRVGWDSIVSIATQYGLDSPGTEYRWRRDFPHPSRLAVGPTHPVSCTMGTWSLSQG